MLPNVWYGAFVYHGRLTVDLKYRLFTHDPDNYKQPSEFRPERFLSVDGSTPERDPNEFVFGFGRRLCPGRYLADVELYLVVATTLALFNIERPLHGDQKYEFSPSGLIR